MQSGRTGIVPTGQGGAGQRFAWLGTVGCLVPKQLLSSKIGTFIRER